MRAKTDREKIQTAMDAVWDLEGIFPQAEIMAFTGALLKRRAEV